MAGAGPQPPRQEPVRAFIVLSALVLVPVGVVGGAVVALLASFVLGCNAETEGFVNGREADACRDSTGWPGVGAVIGASVAVALLVVLGRWASGRIRARAAGISG